MIKSKAILTLIIFLLFVLLVRAFPFIPQGNIELLGILGLRNATNVSADLFCDNAGTCSNISTMSVGGSGGGTTPHDLNASGNHTGNLSTVRVVKDTGTYFLSTLLDSIIDSLRTVQLTILNSLSNETLNRITNDTLTLNLVTNNTAHRISNDTYLENIKLNITDQRFNETPLLISNCSADTSCDSITYDSELTYTTDTNCTVGGVCPLITYDTELAYIENCSVDQVCANVLYTTDQTGNTSAQIWAVCDNGTFFYSENLDNGSIVRSYNTSWPRKQLIGSTNLSYDEDTGSFSINMSCEDFTGSADLCDGDDDAGAGSYDLNVSGDSGTGVILNSEILTIAGGANCSTVMSGDTLTVNCIDTTTSDVNDTDINITDLVISTLSDCDTINITGDGKLICGADAGTAYTADEGNITLDGTVFRLLEVDLAELDNSASDYYSGTQTNSSIAEANTTMKGYVDDANASMKSYVDAQDYYSGTQVNATIAAKDLYSGTQVNNTITDKDLYSGTQVNSSITITNTSMKGYVDAQDALFTNDSFDLGFIPITANINMSKFNFTNVQCIIFESTGQICTG